jgi:hypothetical protein
MTLDKNLMIKEFMQSFGAVETTMATGLYNLAENTQHPEWMLDNYRGRNLQAEWMECPDKLDCMLFKDQVESIVMQYDRLDRIIKEKKSELKQKYTWVFKSVEACVFLLGEAVYNMKRYLKEELNEENYLIKFYPHIHQLKQATYSINTLMKLGEIYDAVCGAEEPRRY